MKIVFRSRRSRHGEQGVFLGFFGAIVVLALAGLIYMGARVYVSLRASAVLKAYADTVCGSLVSAKQPFEWNISTATPGWLLAFFVAEVKNRAAQDYFVLSRIKLDDARLVAPALDDGAVAFQINDLTGASSGPLAGVESCKPLVKNGCYYINRASSIDGNNSFPPGFLKDTPSAPAGVTQRYRGNTVICEFRGQVPLPLGGRQIIEARSGWTRPVNSEPNDPMLKQKRNYDPGLYLAIDVATTTGGNFHGSGAGPDNYQHFTTPTTSLANFLPSMDAAAMSTSTTYTYISQTGAIWPFPGRFTSTAGSSSIQFAEQTKDPTLENKVRSWNVDGAWADDGTNTDLTAPEPEGITCDPVVAGWGTSFICRKITCTAKAQPTLYTCSDGCNTLTNRTEAQKNTLLALPLPTPYPSPVPSSMPCLGSGYTCSPEAITYLYDCKHERMTATHYEDTRTYQTEKGEVQSDFGAYWVQETGNLADLSGAPQDWTQGSWSWDRSPAHNPLRDLVTACVNPYTLVRNLYLRSIVELAGRTGALTQNTEILLVPPQSKASSSGVACTSVNTAPQCQADPPIVLVPRGRNLKARLNSLPAVDFFLNLQRDKGTGTDEFIKVSDMALSGPLDPASPWLFPNTRARNGLTGDYYTGIKLNAYHSLIRNQLRLCQHLYNDKHTAATSNVRLFDLAHGSVVSVFDSDADMVLNNVNCNLSGGSHSLTPCLRPHSDSNAGATIDWLPALTASELVGQLGTLQMCPFEVNGNIPNQYYQLNPQVGFEGGGYDEAIFHCLKPVDPDQNNATAESVKLRGDLVATMTYIRDQISARNAAGRPDSDAAILLVLANPPQTGAEAARIRGLVDEIQGSSCTNCERRRNPITVAYFPTGVSGQMEQSYIGLLTQAFYLPRDGTEITGNNFFTFSPYLLEYDLTDLPFAPKVDLFKYEKYTLFWGSIFPVSHSLNHVVRSAFEQFDTGILRRRMIL